MNDALEMPKLTCKGCIARDNMLSSVAAGCDRLDKENRELRAVLAATQLIIKTALGADHHKERQAARG